jgi:hypothetical protein
VKSDFSERQFEAAVNIELVSSLSPYMDPAVPVVPTTNQEAREGWDALVKLDFGYWYYLQYKVSNYASKHSHRNTKFWEVHRGPYFRFPFHVDSRGECNQHRLLTELRQTWPGVYYCVPAFVREEELWERVRDGSVLNGSRLFDVEDLPLPSYEGTHQVSFDDSGLTQVWSERGKESAGDRSASIRRSERNRRPIDRGSVGSLLEDASRIALESRRERGPRARISWFGARFPERIAHRDEPDVLYIADELADEELLVTTARILQLDFGLTWVIDPGKVQD